MQLTGLWTLTITFTWTIRQSVLFASYRLRQEKNDIGSNALVVKIMSSSKKTVTIAIEGNIGSGKTTLLTHLAQSLPCDVIDEPVETWTKLNGHNLLGMLYDDPHRWCFAFEMSALMSLAKNHTKTTITPLKIMERSIYSTRHCFTEHFYRNQVLHDVEYELVDKYFQSLVSNDSCHLDLIIYPRAMPEICLERVRARGRPEEAPIDGNYLEALHNLHEEWLLKQDGTQSSPRVCVVDASQTAERVHDETRAHIQRFVCE